MRSFQTKVSQVFHFEKWNSSLCSTFYWKPPHKYCINLTVFHQPPLNLQLPCILWGQNVDFSAITQEGLQRKRYLQIHWYLWYRRTSRSNFFLKESKKRTSLVVQWLRILLPMQGTQVRALVREDPTCHGATKPVRYNYWTCALEPASHHYWACVLQLLKPVHLEPMLHNKRSHHNEKPAHHNKELPLLATTRESPRAAMKTQCSHKSTNQSINQSIEKKKNPQE